MMADQEALETLQQSQGIRKQPAKVSKENGWKLPVIYEQ